MSTTTPSTTGDTPYTVDVFVEIPKGSRNKYEWKPETGRFTLDRMLFSSVHYPGDYGFCLDTFGGDGDPLDALVILSEPTFPGCTVLGRVVGAFWMHDDKGRDTKILTVPDSDPRWAFVRDLDDVPSHLLAEIEHFFSVYKDLERKTVTVEGFGDREAAWSEIEADMERYRSMDNPPQMPGGRGSSPPPIPGGVGGSGPPPIPGGPDAVV